MLSIVMYHYVRPIKNSDYPNIKGLELEGFQRQLDYLMQHYTPVTSEDVLNWAESQKPLPEKACYLTFDDGYKDHIDYVLPALKERGLHGAFFPPENAISRRKMLDVNKIHYILASASTPQALADDLDDLLKKHGMAATDLKEYWQEYGKPNRFDTAEVIYFKRMLQHVLPETTRNEICEKLFNYHVGESTTAFAEKLYMNEEDLKTLLAAGMSVGSHGANHVWLNKLSYDGQKAEIEQSVRFLERLGVDTKRWIMCYPYGGYNYDTLDIIAEMKCKIGLTTNVGYASDDAPKFLQLSRFDTNDFPQ